MDAEKDVFTPEQIGALVGAAEGDWKGAILVGFYSGLRLRDVTELRWDAVDLQATRDPGDRRSLQYRLRRSI
ncbi:MAG: hypothetical protein M3463_09930 [Verrucomicrobiota bacterium]|nr:hypothetical protein [Verrucomicrobiota bacterium]